MPKILLGSLWLWLCSVSSTNSNFIIVYEDPPCITTGECFYRDHEEWKLDGFPTIIMLKVPD